MKKLIILLCSIVLLLTSFGCCTKIYNYNHPELPSLVNHLNKSTIMMVKEDPWGTQSFCSGVWINENHIVTAKHCVGVDDEYKKGNELSFQTYQEFDGQYPYNKNTTTYTGKVVALGKDIDIAVMKVSDPPTHNIARIFRGRIYQGSHVHIVSHPVNMTYNYTQGLISQIRNMDVHPSGIHGRYFMLHITTSATVGSSGSGVYNDKGELLGIASFLAEKMPGAMFYLHRDLVIEVLEENSITYY